MDPRIVDDITRYQSTIRRGVAETKEIFQDDDIARLFARHRSLMKCEHPRDLKAPEVCAVIGLVLGAAGALLGWPTVATGPVPAALSGAVAGCALGAMMGCLIGLAMLVRSK